MKFLCQLAAGVAIGCLVGYKSLISIIENCKENNNNK